MRAGRGYGRPPVHRGSRSRRTSHGGERDERAHAEVLRRAVLQDLVADDRVPLHHPQLGLGELVGLQQDVVRKADLADVVERRGELDRLRLLGVEANRLAIRRE